MSYEIVFSPQSVEDLRNPRANIRATVMDAIQRHLQHEPTMTSKSRIKRLRGLSRPQYRLRADEARIFYDVTENAVEILAIVPKSGANAWLERAGVSDEESSN